MSRNRWMIILLTLVVIVSTVQTTLANSRADTACAPGKKTFAAGTTTQQITSGGLQRTYRLHIPPRYDPALPAPLVFSIHGFASNASQQEFFSRWSVTADQAAFIAVYPQGTGFPARWNSGRNSFAQDNGADDVQFFRDMLTALTRDLCIDPTRIYVNGLSNGGGMTNRLACEMADTFAAFGIVAGAYAPLSNGCHPARPVPIMFFHGTADPIVSYMGNTRMTLPPVKDWIGEWVARNGCQAAAEAVEAKGEVSGVRYNGCTGDATVIFYTINGGGHTWPGGNSIPALIAGKTTTDINATETMWQFFVAYPLVK
ncbi:MAG: prolyl oligopeptidase family serine peptidase [Anaerolineae bacterium]|nr:prolyl oligopeptidase family serine peptidase [Anaerolineae bacterium]